MEPSPIMRRNPKLTNWLTFRTLLESRIVTPIGPIESAEELEETAGQLGDTLMSSFHESCPERRVVGNREVPWWNEQLYKLRKNVRKLFNRAKGTGNWDGYRSALTTYNREIRRSKRRAWRLYCESVTETPMAARLQRTLAKDHSNRVGLLKRPDGTFTKDQRETLELLLQVHFPGSVHLEAEGQLDYWRHMCTVNRRSWSLSGTIFSRDKVRWAVDSFDPFKAPGPDGIFPALIQRGLDLILDTLILIFRGSFILGYIPKDWRKVSVVFIPKLGKRPSDLPRSYRPISLTSFLLKTMERLIDLYIREKIKLSLPLQPTQFAYCKGGSTEGALHSLVSTIENVFSTKELALCAFVDVEGAFDNTGYHSIKRAMMERGIDMLTVSWVRSMLSGREITSTLGDESVSVRARRGCPQGGVLSPLLWSLVMDDLLVRLKESGYDAIGYADDLVVIVRGKYGNVLSDVLQRALNLISSWCDDEGLSINPAKTTIVPFTRRYRLNIGSIILKGTEIGLSREIKYLGVTLDMRLNWNAHLSAVLNKATRAMWACRCLIGRTWGLDSRTFLWLYTMIVRPIISYASVVWWPKTKQKVCVEQCNKLQRQVCLATTGAMGTCPTAAIEAFIGLTPLHIFIMKSAALGALRLVIRTGRNSGDYKGHMSILGNVPDLDMILNRTDMCVRTLIFGRNFRVLIRDREEWDLRAPTTDPNCLRWYTDGSKTDNGVGAGIFGPNTRLWEPMGKWPSVFQAEVQAISSCAQVIGRSGIKGASIIIYSDSRAALMALSSDYMDSKLVNECYINVHNLALGNKVTLCWVPGHSGVEGNEIADELARRGSSTNFVGPEPYCGISWSTARKKVDEWEHSLRMLFWAQCSGMRQAKRFMRPFTYGKELRNMDRATMRKLIGFLTGHYYLKYHLFNLGRASDMECRLCREGEETAEHMLCECVALANIRRRTFTEPFVGPERIRRLSIRDVVKFIDRIEGIISETTPSRSFASAGTIPSG